jgi:serine/threonine-protein kinase RsbT
MSAETRVPIERETDVVTARQKGRELAAAMGFSGTDQTLVALAISETARNIVSYAERGEIVLGALDTGGRRGILIIARDDGPGIADPALAMQDGYSTAKSLGVGLPGAKRVMDEFDLASTPGKGTTVTMKKWLR